MSERNSNVLSPARMSRRGLFRMAAAVGLGAAIAPHLGRERPAQATPIKDRKLLFVFTATGGASIVDSFLPVLQSEAGAAAPTLLAYPDVVVKKPAGSQIRHVVNLGLGGNLFSTDYDLGTFLTRHGQDTVVVTQETTSVNHVVAQKRAVTGANVNRGRTVMEAVAEIHGEGLVLPNANLAGGSYVEPGDDPTLPAFARAEVISNPLFFALSTDGSRGIEGAPSKSLIARARAKRQELEAESAFLKKYGSASMLSSFEERRKAAPALEASDALTKLMLLPQGKYQLSENDLQQSPMLAKMMETFPNLSTGDSVESQAAVGFLLAYYGLSASVTLGPTLVPSFLDDGTIVDTPLIFDFSHNDHVLTQNVMWGRMMKSVDGLITLLKEQDYLGDPANGKMWDRSLIYIATDFGRTKERPSGATTFGSGHDLSNGNVLISPLLKGNRVYGGVDPKTAKTYGFDPMTGDADPTRVMREGDIYSLVCHAMGVEFEGRRDMPALIA